ncbi:unnamed protein product [Adineta ricciae]|nr:unnamed protein product [Adineta ricciae]
MTNSDTDHKSVDNNDDDADIFREGHPDPISTLCASISVGPLISPNDNSQMKKTKSKWWNYSLSRMPKTMRATAGLILLAIAAIIIAVPTVCLTEPKNSNATTTNDSTTGTIDLSSLRWSIKATSTAGVSSQPDADARALSFCIGITFDASSTLFIADYENNRIQKKISNAPNSTTIVGKANTNSTNTSTTLNLPTDVAVDSTGNIFVVDSANHRVLLWTANNSSLTIVAGTGSIGSEINELNTPWGIALDGNANKFYIADQYNNRIMQYELGSLSGTIVAGGNGAGKDTTQLFCPHGIYFDLATKSLYISNFAANNVVRWVIGDHSWTLVAGSLTAESGSTSTLLYYPSDVILDVSGNIYVADTYNHRVQLFLSGSKNATTIAGTTGISDSSPLALSYPYSLAFDKQYNLYVADSGNYRVQKLLRY